MNYQKHYDSLIERARDRILDCYVERHHVIPKCIGGSDEPDNLVALTAEEHYVAHQLLAKIHKGNGKLIFAAAAMTMGPTRSNKLYGWLRRSRAKAVSKALTGIKRGPFSAEHREKISVAHQGKTLSDEQKEKISKSMREVASTAEHKKRASDVHTGRKRSDETCAKISAALKGKPISKEHAERSAAKQRGRKQPVVQCPHCDKSGGQAIMHRFHFNNCKVLHG